MNFKAEVDFEGFEVDYINADRLARIVKMEPKEYVGQTSVSYGELLTGLCEAGVKPEDISGIYKVSVKDSSYSVLFKYDDAMLMMHKKGSILINKVVFNIMKMDEQIVTLRVHWLPLYMDNSLLREVFAEYAKVIDVVMLKTSHAIVSAYNGVREVSIKTDEFRKQRVPHLVNFNSGQSMLVTMQGRDPYCLKCRSVGHIRSRCPTNKRFNQLFTEHQRMEAAIAPAPPDAPAPQANVTSGSDFQLQLSHQHPRMWELRVGVLLALGRRNSRICPWKGRRVVVPRGDGIRSLMMKVLSSLTKQRKRSLGLMSLSPPPKENNFLNLIPGVYSPSDQVPPS